MAVDKHFYLCSICVSYMHRNPLSSEHNKTTSKKPWFNNDCRTARTKYHLAKKMHNRHKTLENKAYLAEMSKAYKKNNRHLCARVQKRPDK